MRPSLQGLVRAACLSSLVAGSAAFAETSLNFSGDAGDYVTQGQTYAYTPADGTFQARLEDGLLLLDFQGPNVSDYWSVRAEAPENESLTAGTTYFDAERASVPKSGPFAGFDFFGNHRGCNRIAAHFRVKRLELSQAGVVNAAWIVFESHCEGNGPAARGQFRYNVDVAVDLQAPFRQRAGFGQPLALDVRAVSVNAVQLTAGALPAGASFTDLGDGHGRLEWTPGFQQTGRHPVSFYADDGQGGRDSAVTEIEVSGVSSFRVESEPGAVGNGASLDVGPTDGRIDAFKLFQGGVEFLFQPAGSTGSWNVYLAGPGQTAPVVGVYENAARWPFGSPTRPLIWVQSPGQDPFCQEITGRFEVKEITWNTDQTLRSLWATFEQRCVGKEPATYGEVKFNASSVLALRAPFTRKVTRGQTLSFGVSAQDLLGRPVTLSALGLPQGSTFTDHGDGTGTFSWAPTSADIGTYTVEFRADNGQGQQDHGFTVIKVSGESVLALDFEPNRLGEGGSFRFTSADGPFKNELQYGNAEMIHFGLQDAPYMDLGFQAPGGAPLDVGTYEDATRIPSAGGAGIKANGVPRPGLSRFCSQETGTFRVKQIKRSASGALVAMWVTFIHFCDGEPDALTGELRYNVDVALAVHAPFRRSVTKGETLRVEVTTERADPTTTVTLEASGLPTRASFQDRGDGTGLLTWIPRSGQTGDHAITFTARDVLGNVDDVTTVVKVLGLTALRMSSAPNDFILGLGQDYDYTPSDGKFTVVSYLQDGVVANFTAHNFYPYWDLSFVGPDGAALAPGSYPNAGMFPAPGPGRPGLLVSRGVTCDLEGAFQIKALDQASDGSIRAFWVKFEEHCLGVDAPLIGELRYNLDVPLILDAPPGRKAVDGEALTFDVRAISDDTVTLATVGDLPAGAQFEDHGNGVGTFTWTPPLGQTAEQRVRFRAHMANGLEETAETRIWVRHVNRGPIADAGGPYFTTVNEPIVIDGGASRDPEGDPLQFIWDFGDGTAGYSQSEDHVYYVAGIYPVSLTVYDPSFVYSMDTTSVVVRAPQRANAFVSTGQPTIRLGSGKPELCIQVEPLPGEFAAEQVSTIEMYRQGPLVNGIFVSALTFGEDRNHNGISEVSGCFRKEDLQGLFADIHGRATVPVIITGRFPTEHPSRFEATMQLEVVSGGKGALQALVSRDAQGMSRLSFETTSPGFVRVGVYDLAGRRVLNAVDELSAAAGAREVALSQGLSPGVYFYRIEVPGHSEGGRFVILR